MSTVLRSGGAAGLSGLSHEDRRSDARWSDGILATVALWTFTLLVYLPVIIARHRGEGLASVLLDSSTVLVSMLLTMVLFALFRRTLGLPGRLRLVILISCVLVVAFCQAAFDLLFTALIAKHFQASWETLPTSLKHGYGTALNYAAVFGVNLAVFQLAAGRRRAQRQERELVEFRAAAQQAEVDSLRLKLNPHFLFNTLNAISAMVVTRRNGDAEQGLERLSAFLRASIECDAAMLSPLEDELHRLDHYVQIEEMRFGERLSVCFDCPGAAGTIPVPALMIQSLIETAIRDGVEPTTRPVTITVRSGINDGCLELVVDEDAPRPDTPDAAAAVADIRRRLRAFYGAAAEISVRKDAEGVSTLLRLPVPDAT